MLQDEFAAPIAAAAAMVGFHKPWCIAGGWGLDLWLGKPTRMHSGVVFSVLRDHQIELRDYLHDWSFKVHAMTGKLVPWTDRQLLMLPVNELYIEHKSGQRLHVLFNESDGIDWHYSYNYRITLNMSKWITKGNGQLPVIAPEISLLYKSKTMQPQDQLDFNSIIPHLDEDTRNWLRGAILQTTPNHPWANKF